MKKKEGKKEKKEEMNSLKVFQMVESLAFKQGQAVAVRKDKKLKSLTL